MTVQSDGKFATCCFWASAGSRNGYRLTCATVTAAASGRTIRHSVLTTPVDSGARTALAALDDGSRGEQALSVAELRDLIGQLTRDGWRIVGGGTVQQMVRSSSDR